MTKHVAGSSHVDDRSEVIDLYRDLRESGQTPEQALNFLLGSMLDMVVAYTASPMAVPTGLLVSMGDVARWRELAHAGEPLPEDLL